MSELSHVVNETLYVIIFDKEKERLQSSLDNIQDIHASRYGCRAFILDGKVIWNNDVLASRVKNKKHIDEDLKEEARSIIKNLTKLNVDTQRFNNFFSVVSRKCTTRQDYRDVFPDMVSEPLSRHLQWYLPRTRDPGYAFLSSPAKEKLFNNSIDMIYYYLANTMVFK